MDVCGLFVTALQVLLDAGQNVPPDAYPGAIPPGYGGFLPGYSGSQLPNIPDSSGSSPYHDAAENCRNVYNGLNSYAQDTGTRSSRDHMVGGHVKIKTSDPQVKAALDAWKSCTDAGFTLGPM